MTIRDFQYMIAIAEENNITKAAQRLYISQPSLSQALKKVEAELNATLFTRTNAGLVPTFIGEQFLIQAKEILGSYRKLEHFISDVNNLQTGRLQIGVPYYLNGSFLSEILPTFNGEYPGVDVHVTQQTDLELENMLSLGSLDFIIGLPEAISSKFEKSMVLKCRLVLSTPPGHPLESQGIQKPGERFPTLSLKQLEGETLLEFSPSNPLYHMIKEILSRSGAQVHLKQLSGYGVEMVRRCSKAGMGFAIVPECMLIPRTTSPSEKYFYLENDEDIFYSICTARSPESYLPLAAGKLLDMARQYFKNGSLGI
ncbi:LysR family transcriptional regulator [Enterocloster lavalensis]|uniref:LysR family transcriptional regulator n=1 Tax=Enterocloster lavalensis TaxID=460384 RepID=UPI001D091DD9|nr:LysR family transcriptional regulator [Enterocloster lavalensis]MCB6345740.1 LysR family transcriptional regulator [Enterocloster lavalensis]